MFIAEIGGHFPITIVATFYRPTCYIDESEKFTKEVSVGPEVVLFQIGIKIVYKQFLFQFLVCIRLHSQIEIHSQGENLSSLPVFPEPTRYIEGDALENNSFSSF